MSESSDERATADESAVDPGDEERPSDAAPDPTSADGDGTAGETPEDAATGTGTTDEVEALRQQVDEKYDFDDFGPSDMAEMSAEEWEAAFDPETWIVGPELLDRVETDLKGRIASRDVFAVLERFETGGEEHLVAYSDEGYAIVAPDGSVEGRGTVVRDVKPSVALCSMDSYEVPDAPADVSLPSPDDVPEGTGQLGNNLLQLVAFAQLVAGLGLIGAWLFTGLIPTPGGYVDVVAPAVGLVFVGIAVFLFAVVANARLSDRFRAEEFRQRLRAVGVEDGDRPDFLPPLEEPAPEATTGGEPPDADGSRTDRD